MGNWKAENSLTSQVTLKKSDYMSSPYRCNLPLPKLLYVTFFGKMDTNAFPFMQRNRLQFVYIRLNTCYNCLNGLLIRLNKDCIRLTL